MIEWKECNSKLEEILPMRYHNYEKIIDKKLRNQKVYVKIIKNQLIIILLMILNFIGEMN